MLEDEMRNWYSFGRDSTVEAEHHALEMLGRRMVDNGKNELEGKVIQGHGRIT
jgi:hypothetical protein